MKRKMMVWMLAAVMIGSMAGCGADEKKEQDNNTKETVTENAEEETEEGITAYVGTSLFESSLDPIKGAMTHGYPFINNALLRVNPESEYVGDLATDWTISEDALTYTFNLRQDVKFSDGSDFTAEDVVFTYEEVQKNQANNEYVDLTRLESVTAVDDYTVEFKLKENYSPFFDTIAMLQIVPSDAYDSELFDTAPIGTGAWKMVQYDANQQMILQANPDCYYGEPEIDKVTLVYMDGDAAYAAAQSGQLDVVMVGTAYTDKQIDGMTMIPFETMDVRNISLPVNPEKTVKDKDGKEVKTGNNVTSDLAVRKALSIGIDRQQIIDHAFNGIGKPAVNFTSNLIWANTEEYEDCQVDEAKQILEEAGWMDSDQDGIREKDGQVCAFDVYTAGGDQDRYQLAVALAENAAELGVGIEVKTATWDEIIDLQYSSGVVWGWGQYSPTVLYSLYEKDLYMTGGFDNVVGYDNPEVEARMQEAIQANDQETAIAAWKEVQKTAEKDYPYLYLVNIEHCYFVNDKLDISQETQIPHPHGHGAPVICNMSDWKWK